MARYLEAYLLGPQAGLLPLLLAGLVLLTAPPAGAQAPTFPGAGDVSPIPPSFTAPVHDDEVACSRSNQLSYNTGSTYYDTA